MQTKEYRCLGLTAKISVPSDIAEFDKLAKKDGACFDEAVSNVVYRGVLNGIRDSFCEAVQNDTKIERKTKDTGKKDAKGQALFVYDESEGKYIDRVQAALGLDDAAFAVKFQSVMDDSTNPAVTAEDGTVSYPNAFDPSQTERKSLPKKLAAVYTETATRVFSNGNQQKIADRILSESGTKVTFVDEGDGSDASLRAKNIEALGWAIKANEAFKEKERQQQYA